MTNKTPAVISAVITVVLLVIITVLSLFFEMVALDGATEKQGIIALSISLVCHILAIILLGLFASRFTKFVITKFNLNKILAAITAVILAIGLGVVFSFFTMTLSILGAGVR